jgi:imidazole glycerol-phosphate synthase subunit HisH
VVTVGIVDYGVGNLKSVSNAVERMGGVPEVVSDPVSLARYERLILPGVGAFREAIATLRATGLGEAVLSYARSGRPLLGICLGMQLLCASSSEAGLHEGLAWFDAKIVRFEEVSGIRVPQMGWNTVRVERDHPVFANLEREFDCYFLHSYHATEGDSDDVIGTTSHGVRYPSVLARANVCAMQFHPEKSQPPGLRLLANFIAATAWPC